MIETSALFAEKIAESSRQFRARLLYDGAAISGEIRNITINKGACGESFSIGSIYSSYIEVTLDSCEELLENKELLLQIGLVIDDTVEYIDMGYYTVTKPSRSIYQTTFTAVGRITSKLNKVFDVPAVLTLRNIANAITAATGVTIIFNGEVSDAVLAKDITGMTCKEALSVIVGTFGGFATEDNSGNIVVSKYVTTSKVSVDRDRMTALPEFNDLDYNLYGIKVVVSAAGEDEDGNAIEEVAFTAGAPRLTVNNEFMTAGLFESFLANTLGYTYRPGTVSLALGDPRLQPWDYLEVTDVKERIYIVPCLNIVHTFDGGLTTTITAPGESESESGSTVAGPITQQLERMNAILLTVKEAIVGRLKADDLESEVANLGYATVKELEAVMARFDTIFTEDIMATGDFNLGGSGALRYDSETDSLSINASNMTIDAEKIALEKDIPIVHDWAQAETKPDYTYEDVGADSKGTAESKVSEHNTNTEAHNDIRLLIQGLTSRLNTLADSDDTTLDQMSELVAYIKSNRSLIEEVTTNKVNVSDIIDNLTTNVSNKPLSAKQGKVLKDLVDALTNEKINKSDVINDLTSDVINEPLAAKQGKVLKGLIDNITDELIDKINVSDIVDSLTSTATDKPLSANQGANLKSMVNGVAENIPTKVSQLENDSGFINKVSDNYVTQYQLIQLEREVVKTVNNLQPDANGNVNIVSEDGSLLHTHTWADIAQGSTMIDLVIDSDGVNYGGYHKVSDEVPTLEQLQKGGTISFDEGMGNGIVTMNYPEGDIAIMESTNGAAIVFNGLKLAVVAYEDGASILGNTFEKGISFAQNDLVITHSLMIKDYPAEGATPIPVEYLPESHQFYERTTTTTSDTLTWDGNTSGLDNAMGMLYRVSDAVPTLEDLQAGGTITGNIDGVETPIEFTSDEVMNVEDVGMGTGLILISEYVGIALVGGAQFVVDDGTLTFPKAGIYFAKSDITGDGTLDYISKLAINGYTFEETVSYIKLFDIKYLPESHRFGEATIMGDTLTWDGDTTGKPVVTLDMGDDGVLNFCKVSDAVPTLEDLSNGVLATIPGVGTEELDPTSAVIGDGYIFASAAVVISEPNTTVAEIGLTFPETGVWLVNQSGMYISALTINGYKGFEAIGIKKLDGKYLEPFDYVAGSDTVSLALDGFAPGQLYKLMDDVLTAGDISNSVITYENGNGVQTIVPEVMGVEGGAIIAQFRFEFAMGSEGNAVLISTPSAYQRAGIPDIPSAGVYVTPFVTIDSTATKISLTVEGKEMGGSLKLKAECLPDQEEYIKPVINAEDYGFSLSLDEVETVSDNGYGFSLYEASEKGGFKFAIRINRGSTTIDQFMLDISPVYDEQHSAYIDSRVLVCGGIPALLDIRVTESETTFKLMELALASSFISSEGVGF